jgi:hypothetical protein
MKLAFLALFSALAFAQPQLTVSTSSPVYPGATLNVTVTLSGSAGSNISAIGFALPGGSAALTSSVSGKFAFTNGNNALLVGFNNGTGNDTAYSDGPVATFTYTVPTASPAGIGLIVALASPLASNTSGGVVTISSQAFSGIVGLSSTCVNAIQSAITSYLAAPSQTLLGQITADLSTALTGGSCAQ